MRKLPVMPVKRGLVLVGGSVAIAFCLGRISSGMYSQERLSGGGQAEVEGDPPSGIVDTNVRDHLTTPIQGSLVREEIELDVVPENPVSIPERYRGSPLLESMWKHRQKIKDDPGDVQSRFARFFLDNFGNPSRDVGLLYAKFNVLRLEDPLLRAASKGSFPATALAELTADSIARDPSIALGRSLSNEGRVDLESHCAASREALVEILLDSNLLQDRAQLAAIERGEYVVIRSDRDGYRDDDQRFMAWFKPILERDEAFCTDMAHDRPDQIKRVAIYRRTNPEVWESRKAQQELVAQARQAAAKYFR